MKSLVSHGLSANCQYLIGLVSDGDVLVWHKDTESVLYVHGRVDFVPTPSPQLLAVHVCTHPAASVFISDDARQALLVTYQRKVFVWHAHTNAWSRITSIVHEPQSANASNGAPPISGTPTASTLVDYVPEASKELSVHARFRHCKLNGATATCVFAFSSDEQQQQQPQQHHQQQQQSQLVVNVLNIKWNEYENEKKLPCEKK